jgi:hypothetical protein
MKKHLLLACFLLAGSLAVSAQDDVPPPPSRSGRIDVNRLRFGAFVAPNISWMKPTAATDDAKKYDVQSQGSKIGFTYGLMMDYFFAENYGIVSGLSVTSTGGKMLATARYQTPEPNKVLKADFDYRLQYLNIPLALKLRTDEINGFRFFGQAGISASINIGKKADYTVNYYDGDTTLGVKEKSDSKAKLTGSFGIIAPVLFEMNVGIGLEKPVSEKLRFYAGLFFNNGFTPDATRPDLFDSANLGYAGSFDDAKTRLNNFALRLGLFF